MVCGISVRFFGIKGVRRRHSSQASFRFRGDSNLSDASPTYQMTKARVSPMYKPTFSPGSETPCQPANGLATSALVNTSEKGIERAAESLIKQLNRIAEKPTGSKKEPRQDYRIVVLIYPEPEEDQSD